MSAPDARLAAASAIAGSQGVGQFLRDSCCRKKAEDHGGGGANPKCKQEHGDADATGLNHRGVKAFGVGEGKPQERKGGYSERYAGCTAEQAEQQRLGKELGE